MTSARALATTTGLWARRCFTMRMARRMATASASDVPPNFMTTDDASGAAACPDCSPDTSLMTALLVFLGQKQNPPLFASGGGSVPGLNFWISSAGDLHQKTV